MGGEGLALLEMQRVGATPAEITEVQEGKGAECCR